MPPPFLVLAAIAGGCVAAARLLARARWPSRSPAAAIMLWQALGLGWGLAAVGTLAALGTGGSGWGIGGSVVADLDPLARGAGRAAAGDAGLVPLLRIAALGAGTALLLVLCWVLLAAAAAVTRDRHRQRALLSLLARGDPKAPGALVVDYPAAAAYCLPGLRSAIVLSSATLDLLGPAELAAVLAHERAHLRERHDLVLLPFTALMRAFGWSAAARDADRAVALLIEMLADDRARRHRPARELATALLRFGAAGAIEAPSGALAAAPASTPRPRAGCPAAAGPAAAGGAALSAAGTCEVVGGAVAARVTRLLRPAPGLPATALALIGAAAVAAVAMPAAALLLPL